jgi:hypothetical protein
MWCAPKFLVRPKKSPTMLKSGSSWNLMPLSTSNTKGGESDNLFSYSVLHQNQPTSWLVHIRNHSWCWDKPRATRTHLTHCGPNSREATTFPHIVFSGFAHGNYIQMTFCPGTAKEESRNYPGLDSRDFGSSWLPNQTFDWDEVSRKLVALLKSFPTVCHTSPAQTGVRLIPDF